MDISVVIITLNEEKFIAECITQAMKLSKDVIVVDAESSDRTAEIARLKGAEIISRPWTGFGDAKNYGNSKAKHDWVLSIDGDEIMSDDFIRNLKEEKLDKKYIYEIDICTFYKGKALKHSGFYPLWKKRLFNKKFVRWNDARVHESLETDISTGSRRIKGKVSHYSIKSVESYTMKLDQYARLGARKWIEDKYRPSWIKKLLGPSFRFLKVYFLELGILDGRAGWELAILFMKANRAKMKYFEELNFNA